MNHLSIRIALAAALLTTGCQKTPDPAQPSLLQLETKSFEKLVPGCGDLSKREQPCVTFRVKWPEITVTPDPALKERINSTIRARLHPKDAPESFDAEAAAMADDYQRFRKEFPGSEITYFVRRSAEVRFLNAHMLSLEFNEDDFRGGAHPNSHRDYLNLSPSTGQNIELTQILIPNGLAKLTELAELKFRTVREIEAGKPLAALGYNFPEDKFALSRTWGVSPEGLVIHYNEYDIASHAAGPTALLLPWSEIRVLIRKEAGLVPAQ